MTAVTQQVELSYELGQCSLGTVLVALRSAGIAAVLLGDDPVALVQDLRARFPGSKLCAADWRTTRAIHDVIELIEHPARKTNVRLDLSGTPFQMRVWQALIEIPAGTTTTYRSIAEHIGSPGATRAVAAACAANKIAVAVPCHRVLRHDGSLSGYRWGQDRKRMLLEREGAASITRISHRGTFVRSVLLD